MNEEFRRCQICDAPDAQPYFTKKIRDIPPKKERRRDPHPHGSKGGQPVWRCKDHKPKRKEVVKSV